MTSLPQTAALHEDRSRRLAGWVGLAVLVAVLVAGLMWAKWLPYAAKAGGLADSRAWSGSSIFSAAGSGHSAPIAGAWHFTTTYLVAVWKALVVALLVSAAIA